MSTARQTYFNNPPTEYALTYTIDLHPNTIPSMKMIHWFNDTVGEFGRDWKLVMRGKVYQAQFRTEHQKQMFVNRWRNAY